MKFHRLIDGAYWEAIDQVFSEYFSNLVVLKEHENTLYVFDLKGYTQIALDQCFHYFLCKHKNQPFSGTSFHLNNTILNNKEAIIEGLKKNDFKDIETFLKKKSVILGPEKELEFLELSNHMRNVNTLWNYLVIELSHYSSTYRF